MKYLLLVVSLFITTITLAQETISGAVKDAAGQPIPYVNVQLSGTNKGTITNEAGKYSIEVPNLSGALKFSILGYETKTVPINNVSILDVTLSESSEQLNEVVLTALGLKRETKELGYVVQSLDAEGITEVKSVNFLDNLSGKLAGVTINQGATGVGSSSKITIRGEASFSNNNPLFIVDGVYVDNSSIGLGNNIVSQAAGGGNASTNQDDASNRIADIDPQDIESVEILKGASAAAIYGSAAAGGVVIITTKRGKQGKPQVAFSQVIGFRSPTQLLGLRDYTQEQITALGGPNNPTLREYEAELFDNTVVSTTTRFSTSGANCN